MEIEGCAWLIHSLKDGHLEYWLNILYVRHTESLIIDITDFEFASRDVIVGTK